MGAYATLMKTMLKHLFCVAKQLALGLSAMLFMACTSLNASAADPVTIAVGNDFIPFEYVDENGQPTGLIVDLWQLWSKKTGTPVEFKPAPWAETLAMVKDGRADLHAGLNVTDERRTFMDYGAPLLSTNSYVFSPAGVALSGTIKDLAGFRVGVLNGSLEHSLLKDRVPGAEIAPFDTIDGLYDAIAAKNIRLFADVEQTGLYFLGQRDLSSAFRYDAAQPLDANYLFAAVAKGKAGLLQRVNAGLALITANERARITRRWLAPAQDTPTDDLVVAVSRNYPPFTVADVNGQPAGMLVDIWRLWAEKTGRKIRFKQSSWADTLYALRNGEADIHSGLFKNREREEWIDFSRPVYEITSSHYHRVGYSLPVNFKDVNMGAMFGAFQESYLRQNEPGAHVITYRDDEELLRALSKGEVDVTLSEDATVGAMLGRLGLRGSIVSTGPPILQNDLFFGVRKGDAEMLALVEQGLDAISREELAAIEQRWIPNPDKRVFAINKVSLSPEETAWIKANPVIRVHNETGWPPFNFAEDGVAQGYSIDYMNLLAKKVGLSVEYVTGPTWNEFLVMMKNGELDVMLNIVKTPERQKYLLYTPPYADNPNTILSRRNSPYDSLAQLQGKTVSVPKGFFYEEILKKEFPRIKLHLVKNTLESMKAVSFGKADAAVGELAVFRHLTAQHMMTDLVISGEVKMGNPEYSLLNIAARKDLPVLASILDKGVQSITVEETRSIQRRWLGEFDKNTKTTPELVLNEEEKAWLNEHPMIRRGIDPTYPQFNFNDE